MARVFDTVTGQELSTRGASYFIGGMGCLFFGLWLRFDFLDALAVVLVVSGACLLASAIINE